MFATAGKLTFRLPHQPRRQARNLAMTIDAGHRCSSLGDELLAAADFVAVLDAGTFGAFGGRRQMQDVIEFGTEKVLDVNLGNDEQDSGRFQFFVTVPRGAEEFHAAQFKPLEIVRMMDSALGVGLLIANSDFGRVLSDHRSRFYALSARR